MVVTSTVVCAVVAKHAKSVKSIVVEIAIDHCSDPCCSPNEENLAVIHKESKWIRHMQCAIGHGVAEVLVVFVRSILGQECWPCPTSNATSKSDVLRGPRLTVRSLTSLSQSRSVS